MKVTGGYVQVYWDSLQETIRNTGNNPKMHKRLSINNKSSLNHFFPGHRFHNPMSSGHSSSLVLMFSGHRFLGEIQGVLMKAFEPANRLSQQTV